MASTGQSKRINAIRSELAKGDMDPHASRELYLFAENDGNLYRQMLTPIETNLKRKIAKGTYETMLALLGFLNAVEVAAKHYEMGQVNWKGKHIPGWATPNVRAHSAKYLLQAFEDEYIKKNVSNLPLSKYHHKTEMPGVPGHHRLT
jgi:hypothetical protein